MSIVSSRKMWRQGAQPNRTVGHSTLYLWLLGSTFCHLTGGTHCLSTFAHQVVVDSAVQSGLARGVTGTPTFFLNGQAVGNEYATLKVAIEQQFATGKES